MDDTSKLRDALAEGLVKIIDEEALKLRSVVENTNISYNPKELVLLEAAGLVEAAETKKSLMGSELFYKATGSGLEIYKSFSHKR